MDPVCHGSTLGPQRPLQSNPVALSSPTSPDFPVTVRTAATPQHPAAQALLLDPRGSQAQWLELGSATAAGAETSLPPVFVNRFHGARPQLVSLLNGSAETW